MEQKIKIMELPILNENALEEITPLRKARENAEKEFAVLNDKQNNKNMFLMSKCGFISGEYSTEGLEERILSEFEQEKARLIKKGIPEKEIIIEGIPKYIQSLEEYVQKQIQKHKKIWKIVEDFNSSSQDYRETFNWG